MYKNLNYDYNFRGKILAIYGSTINTAQYVMLLMRAETLGGQVGEGWALEIETFLSP